MTLLDRLIRSYEEILDTFLGSRECNCGTPCEGTCTRAEAVALYNELQEVKKKSQLSSSDK